jgi:Fe-S cluster assembly protein SufD
VNDQFSPTAAAALGDGERRRAAALRAAEIGWPSTETEEWRYSPIGELRFDELSPATAPAAGPAPAVPVPGERAATVTLIDGWVVGMELAPGWADKGLEIVVADQALVPVEVGAEETTALDLLHQAFCPAPVLIRTPAGLTIREPVVVVNWQASPGRASFSHLVVEAGDGSDLLVVEYQGSAGGGVSVPVADLRVGPAARVRYQVLQDLHRNHWQLARQRSTVDAQATLTSGIAAFGARYARLRTDSALIGRGATANLVAAYYGDGNQVHDFRTFQHHHARNTRSDLLFKGAQDGSSGSIYTGMIHIHPEAAGSNAFQTNRNVKLSPDAWAWSVPNLEIENNDVRCSHASTVSPVDEDQRFYLGARGVPPLIADRLIVAGFFDEVIRRLPAPGLQDEVRRQVTAKLDARDVAGTASPAEGAP